MARDYKREWQLEQLRDEKKERAARARARRKFDREHGKSAREDKDLSHDKALARGGTNADGVRLESPSSNRARGGKMGKRKKASAYPAKKKS